MNGPESLLHVVGGQEVGDASKFVKQVVLESEHWRRANNGCLGEDITNDTLTPALGLEEFRWRVLGGIVGRNVDESVNVVFSNRLGDTLRTVNVDVLVSEVPVQVSFAASTEIGKRTL